MKTRRLTCSLLRSFALCAVFGSTSGAVSLAAQTAHAAFATPSDVGFSAAQLPRVNSIVRVVADVGPAVVNIYQEVVRETELPWPYNQLVPSQRTRSTSLGSGVVIDPEGYILTNQHVIQPRGDIQVEFPDGARHSARVINIDPANDVALLKVDAQQALQAATLGTSRDVMVGESVIAIGNPLGNANTVTTGIVSSRFRDVRLPGGGRGERFRDFIQIDAPINPGNSGGPLLNIKGEVIGINWAIATEAEGIGFAIPIDRVRSSLSDTLFNPLVLRDVVTGITIDGVPTYGHVRVAAAQPGSPAERAGLRAGDELLRVGDREVDWEFDFNKAVYEADVGEVLELVVEREGERVPLALKLESQESPMQFLLRRTGMRLHDHPKFYGVFVEDVDPTGPAARLPIRSGDHIDGLDGVDVDDVAHLHRLLRERGSGPVELHLFRAGRALRGTMPLR
ncbi:MAG: peptidase [Planctomycetota bacterium]|nr:MAG: peptidase [Planctomycetota bacterium]